MQVQMDYFSIKFYLCPVNFHSAYRKKHAFSVTLIAKHTKEAVPLEGGRELFSRKKVRRGFLTYRIAINHTTREKPLRLQKTSFFNRPRKLGTP